jgi:hypothetical protein
MAIPRQKSTALALNTTQPLTIGFSAKTPVFVGKWQALGESNPSFQVENLAS